jgi:cation diffusion facilitator family transporter
MYPSSYFDRVPVERGRDEILAVNADSRKVVLAALAGNVAIAACKFAAAIASRSTATLAEAVHSLADTGNQGLLLVGMYLASRPASPRFPFGRSSERYFWPFVVAMLLFTMGGVFAILEGFNHLRAPHADEGSPVWSFAVLGVSLVMEGLSFRVALGEFRKATAGRTWTQGLLEARDPTIPLVLAEDTTAIVGLVLALLAVTATHLSGQHFWDPLGSIAIGVLLCAVALVLARVTHGLLIGESATEEDQKRAHDLASRVDGVERVTQMLTMHLGPDVVLLAMKVAFRPTLSVQGIEEVTDRIEAEIRAAMPQMRKIFIEADSKGDMRGVVGTD